MHYGTSYLVLVLEHTYVVEHDPEWVVGMHDAYSVSVLLLVEYEYWST